MRHRARTPVSAALVLAAALSLPSSAPAQAPGGGAGAPAAGPTTVGVMTVQRQTVPQQVTLPGRAVAYQQTTIRPQVGGEITEIAYQPGQKVEAGTVLFRLRDDTLKASLSAADSAVASAEAAVGGAQATVSRYDRLQGTNISRADLETAQVQLATAKAALAQAQSQRDLARLELDHAAITSPIEGVVDVASVSVGDIVTASQTTALTTVTQLDPIYVDVSESRARILRNIQQVRAGTLTRNTGVDAHIVLETGETYAASGSIVAPGTQVSSTTGTVPFRFQFPNPDRLILPGQFVRVQVTIGSTEAFLVPQRATRRSAQGDLTAFVARGGKAVQVALAEAGSHDNAWIVTEGLNAGDALILDGLTNLREGAAVTTTPVTIDADGVVQNAAPADAARADQAAGKPAAGAPAAGAPAAGAQASDTPTGAAPQGTAAPQADGAAAPQGQNAPADVGASARTGAAAPAGPPPARQTN